jgi:hypothetical protein
VASSREQEGLLDQVADYGPTAELTPAYARTPGPGALVRSWGRLRATVRLARRSR